MIYGRGKFFRVASPMMPKRTPGFGRPRLNRVPGRDWAIERILETVLVDVKLALMLGQFTGHRNPVEL